MEPLIMRPDISVIIPVYNAGNYLQEAVQSVLLQADVSLEIIVVDDASTDGCVAGLVPDSRLRLLRHKTRQGGGAARNHGLDEARGNWIKFLDADDLLEPQALSGEWAAASALGPSQALFGNARRINADGDVIGKDDTQPPHVPARLAELAGQNLLTGRLLHRVETLRAVGGFNPSLPRGQEFDLHFRLALSGVSFHPYPHFVFRYREHCAPHRLSVKGFSGHDPLYLLRLHREHESLLHGRFGQSWPEGVAERMAQRLWEIGRGLLREGNPQEAEAYFERARSLAPRDCVRGGYFYRLLNAWLGPVRAERFNRPRGQSL